MSNNKILNFLYVITACGIGGFATWDKFFNYQKTNNGLAYKIVKPGDKNSICKEDQFVFFEKTISFKDVVIFSSNDNPDYPLAIPFSELKKLNFDGEQFEALNLLTKKGEVGIFKIKIDKVINPASIPMINKKFNLKLDQNSELTLTLKIDNFVEKDKIFEKIQDYRNKKKEELDKKTKIQMNKDIEIIKKHLSDNKIENFKVTESGLHYVIKVEGEGEVIKEGNTVFIDYIGTDLTTGKVFDTSIESVAKEKNIFHEQREYVPLKIEMTKNPGLIEGFAEGIFLLKKNSEATLFIPSVLAYGPNGIPGIISPSACLIFEVKIVDVK